MKKLFVLILIGLNYHCHSQIDILNKTIGTIDTINSIFYQQSQLRGNTLDKENVNINERTFYYNRLKSDSIVGAKAHIYYYDSSYVYLEDIYDGNKLIRKLNRNNTARVFDLIKFPELKKKPFWGKTTPYVIQYMLKYALSNYEFYSFEFGRDTIINRRSCYCVKTILNGKALMPGFYHAVADLNRVETMILFIDKKSYYPQRVRMEVFFKDQPEEIYYTDNSFYNLKFNLEINDSLFNTSNEILNGFKIDEISPK